MRKARDSGTQGEAEIVKAVACPNCGSNLMPLPACFPLFDVQCTRCMFRAQIKTARCAPKDQIFGAGWDILDKNLKTGQLMPPLIVNFQWHDQISGTDRQEIYFFPFLTRDNVRMRQRSANEKRPGYKEFNYVGLLSSGVPRMTLLSVP